MEYTFSEYEKYLYQQNIEACKICGKHLLEVIIHGYPGNKPLKKQITQLINKLMKTLPADKNCSDILFEVKRIIYSYPHN